MPLLAYKKGKLSDFSIKEWLKSLSNDKKTKPGAVDDDAAERIRRRKKRLQEAAEN
jgi:hypothetical protein